MHRQSAITNRQSAVGLDGYKKGWVVARIDEGCLTGLDVAATLGDVIDKHPDVASIGIDMPIGLPEGAEPRPADGEAKKLLGKLLHSVFLTPPRQVIEAPTHAEAIRIAKTIGCPAPSAQAYALRAKILEVAPFADTDARIFEVHPELAFRMLKGKPLAARKRSWAGLAERLSILEPLGLRPPIDKPGAAAPADDVLDAVITAWVAWKHATGEARFLPAEAPASPHHRIWYASD